MMAVKNPISNWMRAARLMLVVVMLIVITACNSSSENEQESAEQQHITVGVVIPHPFALPVFEQYRIQMAALGYEEGRNITYIQKGPSSRLVDLLGYAGELVEAEVDLILVMGADAARLVKDSTSEIPIVFGGGDAPVEAGLVESLEHPGGNITGVIVTGPEARRLELLLEIVPTIQSLYVPYNPTDPLARNSLDELSQAADELDVELVLREFEDEAAIQAGLTDLPDDIDGIFLLQDMLLSHAIEQWAVVAVDHKLPLSIAGGGMDEESLYAIAPLMGYGVYAPDVAQKAAQLSDQILKGINPGDLPVQTADLYLMVNIDTAEAIGVEIPDHILTQAQFVKHWPETE